MADSISIAETNKIRVALGLKPLADPAGGLAFKEDDDSSSSSEDEGSTLENRQAQATDNWQEREEKRLALKSRIARQETIKKARDAARRFAKLEGKGLGEPNEDEEDTRAWLKGQRKRQKEIAKRLEEQLAEQEREAAAAAKEYAAEDLAGIKVAHGLGEFDDGGEAILTLKDSTIDQNEEEGDELENISLVEKDKTQERLDAKKRKINYNPNDDADGSKGLLSQYDEEIDGKKKKVFTLDGKGSTEEQRQALREEVGEKAKKLAISLDILSTAPENDYLDPSTIKVKKPKKSKKSTRQRVVDEELLPVEAPAEPTKKRVFQETSFVDDDDLQASLAAQRRQALKKRKKLTPEELAKQMREEAEEATATPGMDVDEEEPGLIIDETSEFVANLQKPEPVIKRARAEVPAIKKEPSSSPEPAVDDDGDVAMDIKQEDIKDDLGDEEPDLTSTGMMEETTLNQGLAATLNMLTSRGLIDKSDARDRVGQTRNQQAFMAEKKRREVAAEEAAKSQRERDRTSGRLASMTAREREAYAQDQNKNRELQETRRMAELFNASYKPNIELKYVDEDGHQLNQKEAFKHLSHQFHGKGSGKGKTEKRLKKIEDEKKRERESMLDSSQKRAGLDSAMGEVGRREGKAGVRLQ